MCRWLMYQKNVHRIKLTYCDNDPFQKRDAINSNNFDEVLNVLAEVINNEWEGGDYETCGETQPCLTEPKFLQAGV